MELHKIDYHLGLQLVSYLNCLAIVKLLIPRPCSHSRGIFQNWMFLYQFEVLVLVLVHLFEVATGSNISSFIWSKESLNDSEIVSYFLEHFTATMVWPSKQTYKEIFNYSKCITS